MRMPFPKTIEEIPVDYEVLETGDFRGVLARLAGGVAWLGLNLRTKALAISWVAICAIGGVWAIADPRVGPFWSLAFVAALFVYPAALGLKLDAFAEKWWNRLHKCIGGRVYRAAQIEFSDGARDHEGVHVWQRGAVRLHALRVTLDPRGVLPGLRRKASYRAHCEAQAYGYEVARGHRDLSTVTDKLDQWFYFTGLSRDETRDLIRDYSLVWRDKLDSGSRRA